MGAMSNYLPRYPMPPLIPSLPAIPIEDAYAIDGLGVRYRFDVYLIDARPDRVCSVYAFAARSGNWYWPKYIGIAERFRDRHSGHERLREAKTLGATHVLVHTPNLLDDIQYKEAERRLIQYYGPPLNKHHNPFA